MFQNKYQEDRFPLFNGNLVFSERKSSFSLLNVLVWNFKDKIYNQNFNNDPCTKFQLSHTKIRSRTEHGQY